MVQNAVSKIDVYNVLRMSTMVLQMLKIHRFVEALSSGPCALWLRKWTEYSLIGQPLRQRVWQRHCLCAHSTGQARSLSHERPWRRRPASLMSSISAQWGALAPEDSWRHETDNIPAGRSFKGITINWDWAHDGTWFFVQAVKVGILPSVQDAAPAPCLGSCFAAAAKAY